MRYHWLLLVSFMLSTPAVSGTDTSSVVAERIEVATSNLFKETAGIHQSFSNISLMNKLGFENYYPQVYVVKKSKQQIFLLGPNKKLKGTPSYSEKFLDDLDKLAKNIHTFDLPEKAQTSSQDYQKLLKLSEKLDLNDMSLHQSLLAEEPVIISLGFEEKVGCKSCNRVQKKLEEHAKALTAQYKLYHIVVEIQ